MKWIRILAKIWLVLGIGDMLGIIFNPYVAVWFWIFCALAYLFVLDPSLRKKRYSPDRDIFTDI
ncbi:MAG: hypothetical protein NVSMB39_2410 [Candidatus Saccharimonadales bacterium]